MVGVWGKRHCTGRVNIGRRTGYRFVGIGNGFQGGGIRCNGSGKKSKGTGAMFGGG